MDDKSSVDTLPEDLLRQLVPPERLTESLQALREGKRILGLSQGQVWMSDDFDDPLPDEEWGDLFLDARS
jgi:hypothetical protein